MTQEASQSAARIDPGSGGDVDDLAASLTLDVRRDRHAGVHAGLEIDVHDPDEHLLGAVCRGAARHQIQDVVGTGAHRALELAAAAGPDDVVVCLISGGASALLGAPARGLNLEDLIAANRALLESGADIVETNTVRKHLSAIKGGRLALAGLATERDRVGGVGVF